MGCSLYFELPQIRPILICKGKTKGMKMKKLSVSITALAIVAFSNGVFAGFKLEVPVSINGTDTGSWTGAWGSARNDASGSPYLFCRDDGGSAFCGARDSAGTARSCTTTNLDHLSVIRGLTDTSRINVSYSNGECTNISGINGSYYPPKEH